MKKLLFSGIFLAFAGFASSAAAPIPVAAACSQGPPCPECVELPFYDDIAGCMGTVCDTRYWVCCVG